MFKRTLAASVLAALFVAGATVVPATAGTRGYDLGGLLFDDHPFATREPLSPVVAQPAPPPVYAPAYVGMPGQPIPPVAPPAAFPQARPVAPAAPASRPTVQYRPAPTVDYRPQTAAAPMPERSSGKILSEIRLGLMVHDIGPFSSNEEGGFNTNAELLFVSPDILSVIWSPRPHVGASINSEGDTSQVYAGLTWEWSFWSNFFAGFSLGGSVHNGKLKTNQIDRKELGCHLLFRESVEVGYRFAGRHSISGMLDHISNANICDKNEGIDTVGIRYGYSF